MASKVIIINSSHASGDFLSSADNLCKQFGPRSGPTECQSSSGSRLFDLIVFLKEWFENVNLERSQQISTTTKA